MQNSMSILLFYYLFIFFIFGKEMPFTGEKKKKKAFEH